MTIEPTEADAMRLLAIELMKVAKEDGSNLFTINRHYPEGRAAFGFGFCATMGAIYALSVSALVAWIVVGLIGLTAAATGLVAVRAGRQPFNTYVGHCLPPKS